MMSDEGIKREDFQAADAMPADIGALMAENERRKTGRAAVYDPESGEGCCGKRVELKRCRRRWLVPEEMLTDSRFSSCRTAADYERLRAACDFEYWAWRCVEISDKQTGRMIPFRLNRPQRKLLAAMESQRRTGRPVRIILLKARQWGGSTLTQIYFAWLQTVVAEGLNSLICAQVLNTSGTIRRMYDRLLRRYPRRLCATDEEHTMLRKGLVASGDGASTRMVSGRRATVTVGSSFGQDAVRGLDIRLAHLSEVAFWRDTELMKPADFVRAICSGIAMRPLTAVVIESTANGVGNYFHKEWLRAREGLSDKTPVFVAWYEIEENAVEVTDVAALVGAMDEYERNLWRRGLTLEQIRWYQLKRREAADHSKVMAEYPTDDTEAFVNTGFGVFAPELVDRMRSTCHDPVATGEVAGRAMTGPEALRGLKFSADARGGLKVWEWPVRERQSSDRYVVTVDIGGRSAGADWSVIAVMDRGEADGSGPMRIAAQWRGHIDHDLLGWKAAAIASYYNDALLVVESNTLETERAGSSTYILEQLSEVYGHLYARTLRDTFNPQRERRLGFHTNRQTKGLVVESLIRAVREHEYLERDHLACDEMMTYAQLPGGAYAARDGCHDDVVMTRAMAVYVASTVRRSPEASCGYFRECGR